MAEKSMNAKGSSRDNKKVNTASPSEAADKAKNNGTVDECQGFERVTY